MALRKRFRHFYGFFLSLDAKRMAQITEVDPQEFAKLEILD